MRNINQELSNKKTGNVGAHFLSLHHLNFIRKRVPLFLIRIELQIEVYTKTKAPSKSGLLMLFIYFNAYFDCSAI